jgi:hypothetical protein
MEIFPAILEFNLWEDERTNMGKLLLAVLKFLVVNEPKKRGHTPKPLAENHSIYLTDTVFWPQCDNYVDMKLCRFP